MNTTEESPLNSTPVQHLEIPEKNTMDWRHVTKMVEIYGSFALVPVGVLLNIITLMIFYKIKTHKTPTGLHLMCIALADNVVLIARLFYRTQFWKNANVIPNFMTLNNFTCKVFLP